MHSHSPKDAQTISAASTSCFGTHRSTTSWTSSKSPSVLSIGSHASSATTNVRPTEFVARRMNRLRGSMSDSVGPVWDTSTRTV